MATSNDLRQWLTNHFHDYDVVDEPVKGTYGLIWFLSHRHENSHPKTIAVKTIAPELLAQQKSSSDLEYLKREFRIWLELPPHRNVLQAFRFEIAQLSTIGEVEDVCIPVMVMPHMEGSLQVWVDDPNIGIEDRLIALAQTFNGLQHLYTSGLEGHGDLKPSNILFTNLSNRFNFGDRGGWPSTRHPWEIRVADFGWADAWIDLKFTKKAFRQYLAPERIDGHVVPIKSDMFSMGIVVAELLQRHHPARNLKKVLGSEGKWKRWIEKADWNLDGIGSERLRHMICCLLEVAPANRPTPAECISDICDELRLKHDIDIAPNLMLSNEFSHMSSIAEAEHLGHAARRIIGLGTHDEILSRKKLERRINEVIVHDIESCEIWVELADPLIALLEREEGPEPIRKIGRLRETAKSHLENILGKVDRSHMVSVPGRDEDLITNLEPFERFHPIVGISADIAGTKYESEITGAGNLGALALSALAFSNATQAHIGDSVPNTKEFYIAESIRHAPNEPVLYYYRALWGHMQYGLSMFLENRADVPPDDAVISAWIDDLKTAILLSPDWGAPKAELLKLESKHKLPQ
jgi:serine/threonine protein kinase